MATNDGGKLDVENEFYKVCTDLLMMTISWGGYTIPVNGCVFSVRIIKILICQYFLES